MYSCNYNFICYQLKELDYPANLLTELLIDSYRKDFSMSNAIDIVSEFVSAMNADTKGITEAYRRWFTPSTIWDNVGFAKTEGLDQALALIDQLGAGMGMASMKFELLAIAAVGDKVLTERIDYMYDASGNTIASIPLMGIFELDADGKIKRWSDYFDTAGFQAGMAGAAS